MRRGPTRVHRVEEFSHEPLKTVISGGNVLRGRGVGPRAKRAPPGLVSVSLGFRPRVAVTVQYVRLC